MTGRIFDLKEFSVHDGPGCRVTVFMKGCPMRCVWCHNPEGQRTEKELMRKVGRCTGCGLCMRDNRTPFERDPNACPRGLLSVSGEDVEHTELAERLLRFRDQLRLMEGGVTFSGGDPLMQTDFVCETAKLLRDGGLHVAVETSGCGTAEDFRKMCGNVDLVLMDIKLMDREAHIKYTGADNSAILENAVYLMSCGTEHIFRTPLIPGLTDTAENLEAIGRFIGGSQWEKLPYNKLAGAKYPMLGRTYDEKGTIK